MMYKRLLSVLLASIVLLSAVVTPVMASVKAPDMPWPLMHLAFVAPTGQTDNATYIAVTSARLNGTIFTDGSDNASETAEVRFQYYSTAWGVDYTDNSTPWVDGYDSGDKAFVDIFGLSPSTEYKFRIQIQNDGGANSFNGTGVVFTTIAGVGDPSNFKAQPGQTSVDLTWTKGAGSTYTSVRMSTYAFPADMTEGLEIYNGPAHAFTSENLTSGKTYYFTIISLSAGFYSSANATVMATTLAKATTDQTIPVPPQPLEWFQTPDETVFAMFPLYGIMNAFADGIQMPRASFWFFTTMVGVVLLTLLVVFKSGNTSVVLVTVAFLLAIASLGKLIPMVYLMFTVFFGLGAILLAGRDR